MDDLNHLHNENRPLYLCHMEMEGGFKIEVQPMTDPLTKKGEPTEVIRLRLAAAPSDVERVWLAGAFANCINRSITRHHRERRRAAPQ